MLEIVSRVLLALVFIYSGLSKALEPVLFKAVIQHFFSFPDNLAIVTAILVPWLQVVAAAALLARTCTKTAGFLLWSMALFFFGLMVMHYGEVLPYGCGCFGFEENELIGGYHIVRELIILLLASFVLHSQMRKRKEKEENSNF